MGRTFSKLNRKLEEIISSNDLPRSASRKVKKLRKKSLAKSFEFVTSTPAKTVSGSGSICNSTLRSITNTSDTISLKNCSGRNRHLEDSGFFDTLTQLDDTLNDSTYSDIQEEIAEPEVTESYDLPLRPLYFEVPGTGEVLERSRVLDQLESLLQDQRGAVLTGGPCSGKSSVIVDLIQGSHFGTNMASGHPLAHHILGFHFIQSGDSSTADVPRFINSLAAQLTQHPALRAYRDLLINRQDLTDLLSIPLLCKDPKIGLQKGILDPLEQLYRQQKLELDYGIIVVDGLDMEEDDKMKVATIAEFLTMNLLRFPSFLKLLVSHRTLRSELTELMHLTNLSLDLSEGEFIEDNRIDLQDYIENRIFSSASIQSHIHTVQTRRKTKLIVKIVEFILEKESYLYAKLFLNLLEAGYITIKSESFKAVPQSLEEIFHLMLSFQFPASSSYNLISGLLSTLMASSYPLSLVEAAFILNIDIGALKNEHLKIKNLIITRSDGSLMFLHGTLADWLKTEGHRFSIKSNHNKSATT